MKNNHSSWTAAETLVLASASPRRRALLAEYNLPFLIDPDHQTDETPHAHEPAEVFAERMAREKASAVGQRHPGCYVLGVDTVVTREGEIYGKPADAADAERMLWSLSGQTHTVCSGIALQLPDSTLRSDVVRTAVTFRQLTQQEITDYIASGEPMDKAGAYAIQGHASAFVAATSGSTTNVIGLPMEWLLGTLSNMGAWESYCADKGIC